MEIKHFNLFVFPGIIPFSRNYGIPGDIDVVEFNIALNRHNNIILSRIYYYNSTSPAQ